MASYTNYSACTTLETFLNFNSSTNTAEYRLLDIQVIDSYKNVSMFEKVGTGAIEFYINTLSTRATYIENWIATLPSNLTWKLLPQCEVYDNNENTTNAVYFQVTNEYGEVEIYNVSSSSATKLAVNDESIVNYNKSNIYFKPLYKKGLLIGIKQNDLNYNLITGRHIPLADLYPFKLNTYQTTHSTSYMNGEYCTITAPTEAYANAYSPGNLISGFLTRNSVGHDYWYEIHTISYVTFDFFTQKHIRKIEAWQVRDKNSFNSWTSFAYDFDQIFIYASNNESALPNTRVIDESNATLIYANKNARYLHQSTVTDSKDLLPDVVANVDVKAQYVRIFVKNTGGTGAGINEVKMYEESVSVPTNSLSLYDETHVSDGNSVKFYQQVWNTNVILEPNTTYLISTKVSFSVASSLENLIESSLYLGQTSSGDRSTNVTFFDSITDYEASQYSRKNNYQYSINTTYITKSNISYHSSGRYDSNYIYMGTVSNHANWVAKNYATSYDVTYNIEGGYYEATFYRRIDVYDDIYNMKYSICDSTFENIYDYVYLTHNAYNGGIPYMYVGLSTNWAGATPVNVKIEKANTTDTGIRTWTFNDESLTTSDGVILQNNVTSSSWPSYGTIEVNGVEHKVLEAMPGHDHNISYLTIPDLSIDTDFTVIVYTKAKASSSESINLLFMYFFGINVNSSQTISSTMQSVSNGMSVKMSYNEGVGSYYYQEIGSSSTMLLSESTNNGVIDNFATNAGSTNVFQKFAITYSQNAKKLKIYGVGNSSETFTASIELDLSSVTNHFDATNNTNLYIHNDRKYCMSDYIQIHVDRTKAMTMSELNSYNLMSTSLGNSKLWNFSNGQDLSELTQVGNPIDITTEGEAVFSYINGNTYKYYAFILDLSNNTSDFVIDFRFKSTNQGGNDGNRANIFQFGNLFTVYKAGNDYWRLFNNASLVKINYSRGLTPAYDTYGRYTFLYRYSENKWYMYLDGSAVTLVFESGAAFNPISGNTFVRGTSDEVNVSQVIKFGKFQQGTATNTFSHMYFDIGGTYSDSVIATGFA